MGITKEVIENLSADFFEENQDLFLVSMKISSNSNIFVRIDGDNGVSIDKCIELSRAIEHNLDREEEDFSLEVSSYDIVSPLIMERQYKKNEGRNLLLILDDDTEYEGELVEYNMDSKVFILKVEKENNKKIKPKEQKELSMKLENIKKVKIILKF